MIALRIVIKSVCFAVSAATLVSSALAGNPHSGYLPFYHERPTLNETCDPRPNILPDYLYNHHVPYRLTYNRPRHVVGYIAHIIEPSSQEAMSWWENNCQGNYEKHAPAMCKTYFYPKPWEALNVEPRPNLPRLNPGTADHAISNSQATQSQ